MTIPIIPVLEETFLLWVRNLGFFVVLALFIGFPTNLATVLFGSNMSLGHALGHLAEALAAILFQAIGVAAALSLLSKQSPEKTWLVVVNGVQRSTISLIGVQLFLCIFAILLMIPVALIFYVSHILFGLSPLAAVLGELIFLIFLKYALANPLVVAEKLNADAALHVSWRMTRNRFAFVFGCYLIVGVVEWAINYLARLLEVQPWISPATHFLSLFMSTYWFVLSWVMYVRIKAAEELQAVPVSTSPSP
jgi:hypothetical protein